VTLEKRKDGWWIVGVEPYCVDDNTFTDCGPYRTEQEAEDGLRGLERLEKMA
jgi:hypothetical protein